MKRVTIFTTIFLSLESLSVEEERKISVSSSRLERNLNPLRGVFCTPNPFRLKYSLFLLYLTPSRFVYCNRSVFSPVIFLQFSVGRDLVQHIGHILFLTTYINSITWDLNFKEKRRVIDLLEFGIEGVNILHLFLSKMASYSTPDLSSVLHSRTVFLPDRL